MWIDNVLLVITLVKEHGFVRSPGGHHCFSLSREDNTILES
jgi:hypothetical protein